MKGSAVLQLREIRKSFGGLRICDGISLSLVPGELHALIGPNGAGKTTLLDLVTGLLDVDGGTILFRGQDITSRPVHERARCGLARSFQITSLLQSFTVQEHVALALQATLGSSYRFWKATCTDPELQEPAREILAQVGLGERAGIRASNLSYGEQRLVEIAMALATGPDLLLLDEPMAGLGPGSSRRLARLIRSLKTTMTILLVEHDMQTVFSLADRITVLLRGRTVATGTPETIRTNSEVQEAYLGT